MHDLHHPWLSFRQAKGRVLLAEADFEPGWFAEKGSHQVKHGQKNM